MKNLIKTFLFIGIILFPVICWGADTKISDMAAKGAPVVADTTIIVDSNGGANKKITLGTIPANTAAHVIHGTITDAATIYPSSDGTGTGTKVQFFTVTALAQATAFATPPGSWSDGDKLIIRILDDNGGSAPYALDFATATVYRGGDVALPTTTVKNKTMYVGFIYNSASSTWDCVGTPGGF